MPLCRLSVSRIASLIFFICTINYMLVYLTRSNKVDLCQKHNIQDRNFRPFRKIAYNALLRPFEKIELTDIQSKVNAINMTSRNYTKQTSSSRFIFNQLYYAVTDIDTKMRVLGHLLHEIQNLSGCHERKDFYNKDEFPLLDLEHPDLLHGYAILKISNTDEIPVEVKELEENMTFTIESGNQSSYYKALVNLQKSLNEVVNLVKMRGWYGVPHLHGFCVSLSSAGNEFETFPQKYVAYGKTHESTISLWYMISRCDRAVPLCSSATSRECKYLKSVTEYLRTIKNRSEGALSVMVNVARIFEQFLKHRVLMYKFDPTKVLVCQSLDVVISDVSNVCFLATEASRLMSGTICKESVDCPNIGWSRSLWHYQYADRCSELVGLCNAENHCQGIDSSTQACALSPWIFGRLHSAVSAFWSREKELVPIYRCAWKYYPEERCNWTDIRMALLELRDAASKELIGT